MTRREFKLLFGGLGLVLLALAASAGPYPPQGNTVLQGGAPWEVEQSTTPWVGVENRPSSKTGRTYFNLTQTSTTSGVTLRTVTNGKIFYAEQIVLSAFNSNASANGDIRINDGAGTVRIPIVIPQAGIAALASLVPGIPVPMSFTEPIQFSTDVRVVISAGTITYAIAVTGYEE